MTERERERERGVYNQTHAIDLQRDGKQRGIGHSWLEPARLVGVRLPDSVDKTPPSSHENEPKSRPITNQRVISLLIPTVVPKMRQQSRVLAASSQQQPNKFADPATVRSTSQRCWLLGHADCGRS